MAVSNGTYDLYFSGNYWGGSQYGEGWASCSGPLGPCTDESVPSATSTSGALISTGTMDGVQLNGPGGGSWFPDQSGAPGAGWLAIHSWDGACPTMSTTSNCYGRSFDRSLYFVPVHLPEPAQFLPTPSYQTVNQGTAFSTAVDAYGFPTPSLAVAPGSTLPPGVTFVDNGSSPGVGLDVATLAGTASVPSGNYQFTLVATNSLGTVDETYLLTVVAALPNGTTVDGVGTLPPNEPELEWVQPAAITTTGCHGGRASFAVSAVNTDTGNLQTVTGSMTESPAGSGTYTGTIPALHPIHGSGTITITISGCPNPAQDQSFAFAIYIDPGGQVIDTTGSPIVGASVTLLQGAGTSGPFTPVPNGSTVMSVGNRANPDTTSAGGSFGWDVTPGTYEVQASAPGCTNPSDPTQPDVVSAPFAVPPPISNLQLTLACTSNAPVFTGASSTSVTATNPFAATVSASGSPIPAISTAPGSVLPPGIALSDNGNGTATLSGTPSVPPGVYTFGLQATNSAGTTSQTYTVTEAQQPAFTSPASATVAAGGSFTVPVTTTGTPTASLGVTAGSVLPAGVTLTDHGNGTATLSGAAGVAPGIYAFGLIATNSDGPVAQAFTLAVTEPPAITSPASATVPAGSSFTESVTTTGSPTSSITVASGSTLPTGASLTDNGNGTATLSGTASVLPGVYTFDLTATNSAGKATQTYTLTVTQPEQTISLRLQGWPTLSTSGPLSSGSFSVVSAGGTISSVTGTGTFETSGGGSVTVTVDVAKRGPFYIGTVAITDPGARLATTALVFAPHLAAGPNSEVSGTGAGWFYYLKWTV